MKTTLSLACLLLLGAASARDDMTQKTGSHQDVVPLPPAAHLEESNIASIEKPLISNIKTGAAETKDKVGDAKNFATEKVGASNELKAKVGEVKADEI